MKRHIGFALILLIALAVILGCQIADVVGMGPTVAPTPVPIVITATRIPPTFASAPSTIPPTPVVVVPTLPSTVPTPVAVIPTQAPAPVVQPTTPAQVVAIPTQAPAPVVQPTAALPPGCNNPNTTITSLTDNGTVSGLIEIRGTATSPDMQYWKIEYRAETNTNYDQLNRSDKGTTDDVLARLSTKTIANGNYFIRLVIVKKDGNFATPCEFRVRVQN